MAGRLLKTIAVACLLAASLAPGTAQALPGTSSLVVADIDVVLQPGVRHGFWLAPSALNQGYLVEITPRAPSVEGAHLVSQVGPEFDGQQWNDVLRVELPADFPALPVNLRVYSTARWPVPAAWEAVLEPGVWHGFWLGPSSLNYGYVAEVTPLEPSMEGASLERSVVQPEFDGVQWNDVLRVQIPAGQPALRVSLRVYRTVEALAASEFTATLQPGEWTGFWLGPSLRPGPYLVELTPLEVGVDGDSVERYAVQPEFDGRRWNDVLRIQLWAVSTPLTFQIRVYDRTR